MKGTVYALGQGDVTVSFDMKDEVLIIPVRKIACSIRPNGDVYGIFELGTDAYYEGKNIFNDILSEEQVINIRIAAHTQELKPWGDPIIYCEGCTLLDKTVSFGGCMGAILSRYSFTNVTEWDGPIPTLPEDTDNIRDLLNPDPLYRIARALEDIKKSASSVADRAVTSTDELVLTVEELRDLMLRGIAPEMLNVEFGTHSTLSPAAKKELTSLIDEYMNKSIRRKTGY
jgi:hypothetical protein